MKKSNEPIHSWDPDTGIAKCTLSYGNLKFYGEAKCNPEDENIKSERIGGTIAELRATLKFLRFIRDYEIKPRLSATLQLYYAMSRSKQYNKKSYEAKMLYRQVRNYEDDLIAIKVEIENCYNYLRSFISHLDKNN